MSLDLSCEAPSFLGHTEADCKVARPWPEDRRVGEGHFQVLSIVGKVRVPCRLKDREVGKVQI